jgi:hypothetical protein
LKRSEEATHRPLLCEPVLWSCVVLCTDRDERQKRIQSDVDNMRTIILHNADSKKDHIPPVKPGSPGALTYPFDIVPECAPIL